MKVFFGGSFVLFVCYALELTASSVVGVPDANPKTTGESGVHDSPSGSSATSHPGDPRVGPHGSNPGGKGAETHTVTINVDDLPKELERRFSALGVNFKQLVGQLELQWNRETMLQAVLATDQSLTRLKQLNQVLQVLPLTIRNKIERLEQSVENIKTTVYHLIQNRDSEHHSFTGKIGNNRISLDSLSRWVIDLSIQVQKFEQTLNSSSETLSKVSEDVTFELKQLLIFVDRIGRESIPLELQTKVHELESKVTAFISKIAITIKIRSQIDVKIRYLRTEFDYNEKSGKFANDPSLLWELKHKIVDLITEIKMKPNIPTKLIEDARAVKNIILLAEKHLVRALLWKLESVLGHIGTELSLTNNMADLIHIKDNLEYVLAQAHSVQTQNISTGVQIRVFLIEQIAMKYKKIIDSQLRYYVDEETAGVNITTDGYSQRTFKETFEHLQKQYEQLKNLFQFKHSLKILIAIKYQIEKIIIHLNYLRTSGITPFQRQLTENVLKEIKYFYQLVLIKTQTSQPEDEFHHSYLPNPHLEHDTTNDVQPKESIPYDAIIENLNTILVNVDVQLSFPVHLSRIQEISVTLFDLINKLLILEEGHLSADHRRKITTIKLRAIELLTQIQSLTQGKTDETKTYVIRGKDDSKHHFNFEAYIKELRKQISGIPEILRIALYPEVYFNKTDPNSGEGDTRPRDISHPKENFQKHVDCVGRQTYNRDLLLISARVESLQKHFRQLMDGALSADASYYEERDVQAREMLKELKDLHAFSALPRELKLKIEDLQQNLKSFEKHVVLMLRIESTPGSIPLPSSSLPSDKYDDKAGLIETISSFLSRIESIRIQLPKEKSLLQIYQMKMQVHRMLLRVKIMSWNVPDNQRDRLNQLEQEITSLASDIELKIKTIREPQSCVWQIPPNSTPESQTIFSDHQSMISHLFYHIENLMQRLRRLALRPENAAQPFENAEQIQTVDSRIKYLHRAINHLSKEIEVGQVNKTLISIELNRLLLDLKNLKALRLPLRVQNNIDFLTALGNYLKIKLDLASAENVKVNTTLHGDYQRSTHEDILILRESSAKSLKIRRKYFSTKDPLHLTHVLGDIYPLSDKFREFQNVYGTSSVGHLAEFQLIVAKDFVRAVKERIRTKIVVPISSEIGDLARVDPKRTTSSRQKDETLSVEHDFSTLISDMKSEEVKIGAAEIRHRLTAIVNRVLNISKTYTPEAFPKTEARLTKILQSYL